MDGQSAFSGSLAPTPQPELIKTLEGFGLPHHHQSESHYLTVNFSAGGGVPVPHADSPY